MKVISKLVFYFNFSAYTATSEYNKYLFFQINNLF